MDSTDLSFNSRTTSACAKFLLAGEYSVLRGGPALAIPLTHLRLQYNEHPHPITSVSLNGKALDTDSLEKFLALRETLDPTALPAAVSITTTIPIGKGLGSSAALAVAMSRYLWPHASATEIAEKALQGEKLFHGNPSGVDPYCVSLESPMAFTRAERRVEPLDLSVAKGDGWVFYLRDSGGTHFTKHLVQTIGQNQVILSRLERLAHDMRGALSSDIQNVGEVMRAIQAELRELGASTPAIDENISELLALGAQGAKITGSGRGGFVLAIFDRQTYAKLPSRVQDAGFSWSPL